MPGRLEGKIAIITGAAGGIGLESAILFVQQGASVVLSDVNEATLAKAVARLLEVVPGSEDKVASKKCDVSKEADVESLVAFADDKWPAGIDIMFNNAGIMHQADDNALTTEERIWDLTHNINVKGVWFGCKYAIKSMLAHKKDRGSVINTASMVAFLGAATPQLAYTASKGAVLAMTRELAITHGKDGIRFNSLCPGPLNTPLLQDFLDTKEKTERRTVHLPMGRFGEAIEQAYGALYLASDESSYVTAADFLVDGGLTKAYVTSLGGPSTFVPNNQA
ncbi:glucose 1-dehydrogenase [Protomyces lactucae-debilis]|uniref:Glucose 1-dehydrogenase n=1 Tax=Protomyces lactucae-debilis TaxID=2754530 RepID=A0A1Y2FLF4_PROLT|nr:glucose 1-dehydrogenase [Protomyces lactucae-debilis]ORY83605.1 glucose 1-dehydrogenase [Protomyces lactucae-debilis]